MKKTYRNIPVKLLYILAPFSVVFFIMFLLALPRDILSDKEKPFFVRVRIANADKDIFLGSRSKCSIYDLDKRELLDKARRIHTGTKIIPEKDGINVGGRLYHSVRLRFSPGRNRFLNVNGIVYRGDMDVISGKKGLTVINRVFLEDYLKGVVPREVYQFWPFSVLKAQAIVSRSFALYKTLNNADKPYDLTADTFSQVYGGKSSERWRATRAVNATRSEVLAYKGQVLPAYFHACCGGHTRDASTIWGKQPAPLRGVKCPWCRWSPYFRWRAKVDTKDIVKKFSAAGFPVKNIYDIREGERDTSKRLKYVRIRARNNWFEIPIEDFRAIMGGKALRSANFRIKKYPRFYLFSGYGWGHGVGMCQWGAFGLAIRMHNDVYILNYYYPGAEIKDMKDLGVVA